MTGLTISNLVLWALEIATIVVVVGLARQVGVLHLRVRPIGPGQTGDGPLVGSRVDPPAVTSLRGDQVQVIVQGQLSLVAFANPTCTACGPTMQAVKRLKAVEPSLRFLVAVDGEPKEGLIYAESYGLPQVVGADHLKALDSNLRPFVTVLSDQGIVLATGVPNNLEQLESLLAAARHHNSFNVSQDISGDDPAAARKELELVDLRSGISDQEADDE